MSLVADRVRVALKVTPRAARNGVAGLSADAAGAVSLRVQVTAAPEDGKANAALIKLLARAWKLPKSSLSVVTGATSRRKVIEISDGGAALAARLENWMGTNSDG